MADISKLVVENNEYNIKDAEARRRIENIGSDIIEGYLDEDTFYKESTHTTEITLAKNKLYVDITDSEKPVLYYWNGSELVKSGGASENIGSKLTLTTTSSDLFNTEVTFVLEGGESITGSFDATGTCVVYLKFIGTYTITCVDGASKTVENTAFGTVYNVSISALPKAIISITTEEVDFHSKSISYSGPENGSIVFNIGGQASLVVRHVGTYTLACEGYTTKIIIESLTEDISISKLFNKYIIYGFHVSSSESDPASAVTYLEGAVGLTPAQMNFSTGVFNYGSWENAFFMPKPCMLKSDGTVAYYLNPSDYTKKADGTSSDVANSSFDGNAMMEWGQNGTKIWVKVVPDIDTTSYSVYISDAQVDSNYHAWNFYDYNNTLKDHFYTPIYGGSLISSKLRSISGQYPIKSNTAPNDYTYAQANNTSGKYGWTTETYSDRFLINMLLVLMGKSLNTQSVFGNGNMNGYNSSDTTNYGMLASGTMNTKGLFWGSSANNVGVKVFGMENYWGNQYRRLCGWINNKGTQYVKLTYGTADGSTTTGYNMTGSGYINTGITVTSNVSGYTTKYKAGNNFGIVPNVGSGSETTYYSDGAWVYTSDVYVAYVGGYCSSGAYCGAFFVNLSCVASDSHWSIGASVSFR